LRGLNGFADLFGPLGLIVSGKKKTMAIRIIKQNAPKIKNAYCHPSKSAMIPPSNGPITGPIKGETLYNP
jgi:hypothetical protein